MLHSLSVSDDGEQIYVAGGHYRAWTQFRRNERLSTFTHTFEVAPPE